MLAYSMSVIMKSQNRDNHYPLNNFYSLNTEESIYQINIFKKFNLSIDVLRSANYITIVTESRLDNG